jgi:hypothetical protein
MRVPTESRPSSGVLAGVVILILGILIGAVLTPFEHVRTWLGGDDSEHVLTPEEIALQVPVKPAAVPEEPPVNDLRTIHVDLDPEASARLQDVYDRSMRLRYIAQEEGDLVPATIRADGKTIEGKVRIKGDFLDHLDTDKWSLRVELKSDKLWGMSRFSIQHPKTRSYLWEWLFMELARMDGLLAPRTDFVNVVMNGNATGIYYLEEHFTKELVESQGRREGPIVRFVEDTFLDMEQQYIVTLGYSSETVEPAKKITAARVAAYGEKRLAQSENLGRQLNEALAMMRDLQADRDGRRTHELLDVLTNARFHALSTLFRTSHGVNWKSRRYYHNPVTARLEPIVFDTGAGALLKTRDPVEILKYVSPAYLKNGPFYQALFREIGRITSAEYLDPVLAEVTPRLRHFEELMRAEGLDDPLMDTSAIVAELRQQQVHLHELVHPREPVSFESRLLTDDVKADRPAGTIEVQAWANTKVPYVVTGFRLGSGVFLPAASVEIDGRVERLAGEDGPVVLPSDGKRVLFRFRSDEREAILRDVNQIKDAVLSGGEVDKSLKLTLSVLGRLITEADVQEEPLITRKFGADWDSEGGRPVAPSLQEALGRHAFLRHEAETGRLEIVAGTHDVRGDLIVPDGHPLHAGPGTVLRFGAQNAIISGEPLYFEGSEEAPIVLEPGPGLASWAGVAVLQADEKSVWRNVHVRDTDVIRRGGWMMTGGVTFYLSQVDLYSTRFDDAHGEDALNVFGVPCLLDGVVIDTCASDAFDGDFVTGLVTRSTFIASVEDAVDVSGSELAVEDSRFIRIGDKAVSAGEDSTVYVKDCVVESASIGVASKDFSRVQVDGLEILETINYGFALYIKKAEFGPSTVTAENVTLGRMGRGDFIVQTTCELTLNGVSHQGVPVDVKEMYRQKILGQ